jgi:hypothetical protein
MLTERYSIVFWAAVAVLASRVLLEVGRALGSALQRAAARLAAAFGPPRVILVAPTEIPADVHVLPQRRPATASANALAPAPNLLETMSHEEMDRLLGTSG